MNLFWLSQRTAGRTGLPGRHFSSLPGAGSRPARPLPPGLPAWCPAVASVRAGWDALNLSASSGTGDKCLRPSGTSCLLSSVRWEEDETETAFMHSPSHHAPRLPGKPDAWAVVLGPRGRRNAAAGPARCARKDGLSPRSDRADAGSDVPRAASWV